MSEQTPSWWTVAPPEGFTARAEQEQPRMQQSGTTMPTAREWPTKGRKKKTEI